jgi:Zn-dependent peptidase ImmA (M78 family)/transcriptional regulator with XRE-family HTH domain
MDIGQKLKLARETIGYTLEKASEKSGISAPTISAYEHCGTPTGREPKFSQLAKLAEVYRKTIDFFLSDESTVENLMLWRDAPSIEEEIKQTEAEFRQLCGQYHMLEILTSEARKAKLPESDVTKAEEFAFERAESFARKVHIELCLGDIPSASLKRILEERYYVKIFHLSFSGSAISTVSVEFGPAILLNAKNKPWRRNYDLAHELFHLFTWNIFRNSPKQDIQPTPDEEKLANAFASKLLMPEDSLRQRIDLRKNKQGQISLDQLDEIAREFSVSLDALVYRIANLFRVKKEDTEKYLDVAKRLAESHKSRGSDEPDKLPERYCSLAIKALNEGKLSLMQFAKYMDMSYKQAGEYLTEDEDFKDEKISISVT